MSSDEDSEEWEPPELKAQKRTARAPAAGEKKAAAKRGAKPKEPNVPKEPNASKLTRAPKPSAPCKPAKCLRGSKASVLPGMKRKKNDEKQIDCPEEERAEESGTSIRTKEEVTITIYLRKCLSVHTQ